MKNPNVWCFGSLSAFGYRKLRTTSTLILTDLVKIIPLLTEKRVLITWLLQNNAVVNVLIWSSYPHAEKRKRWKLQEEESVLFILCKCVCTCEGDEMVTSERELGKGNWRELEREDLDVTNQQLNVNFCWLTISVKCIKHITTSYFRTEQQKNKICWM